MILYWYTHWFWITTIFIVSTSVAQTIKQHESMTTHSLNNESAPSAHNVTKTQPASIARMQDATTTTITTETEPPVTIPPSVSLNRSTWNLSEQSHNDNTNLSISVIEANVTNTASLINGSIENDTLTTLEATFKEYDNESVLAFDRTAASATNSGQLSAAGITSISVGCVILVAIVTGASYMWYRNRGSNRPQVLNDRSSNLDSSGYIDDTSDNSEEMYSLDNDSFLNSLEAMTIQNYWTDAVKHTKL